MSHHMGSRKPSKIDWEEVRHDIVGGIRSGAYHSAWYVKNWAQESVVHPTLSLLGFTIAEEKPIFDGLKVVGVGYGRTGTVSLIQLLVKRLSSFSMHRCTYHSGGMAGLKTHHVALFFSFSRTRKGPFCFVLARPLLFLTHYILPLKSPPPPKK